MERSIVADSELVSGGAKRGRRWHTVEEKRRIVEETLVSGASVSQVARMHGVNANQVFQWRRQYQAGDLAIAGGDAPKLLPIIVSDSSEVAPIDEPAESRGGSIHVEFPGRVLVTIEAGVDPALASAVLERLTR
jgi:transposase